MCINTCLSGDVSLWISVHFLEKWRQIVSPKRDSALGLGLELGLAEIRFRASIVDPSLRALREILRLIYEVLEFVFDFKILVIVTLSNCHHFWKTFALKSTFCNLRKEYRN